jgi:hypothetical protein
MANQNLEATRNAINQLITKRGARARHLWNLVAGNTKLVPPDQALRNLQNIMSGLTTEAQAEAKELMQDIQDILNKPPLP